jgi:MFS family permease
MVTTVARPQRADILHGEIKPAIKGRWHAMWAAFLGEAFDAMDASIFFVAMYPAISELLQTKSDTYIGQIGSVVLATFMMGWFLGAFVFGALADKIGRRKVMLLTILIYSAATGCCALSHNWMELAACRFIVGLGIGGEICLGTVIVSEFWSGKGRLWATACLESSFNVGLLLSAGANALFGDLGWRVLFLVGIIPALFTLYIRSKLTESDSFAKVAAYRQQLENKKGTLDESEQAFLISPFRRLMQPELRGRLISTAALSASAIIGYWACVAWLPSWINQLTGTTAVSERSVATTVFSVGGLFGCFITPIICAKLGRRLVMKIAFGGALFAAMTMFITIKTFGLPLLVWSFALGILTNLQFTALQLYIPEVFPTSVLATAAGICYGGARVFSAVLALCGAQLIAIYGGSFGYASATISSIYVLGFVAAFFIVSTKGDTLGDLLPQKEKVRAAVG